MSGSLDKLNARQLAALRARARAPRGGVRLQPRSRPPARKLADGRSEVTLPCSYAQARMWILEQWQQTGHLYHVVRRIGIDGELDPDALQRALDALVDRHESLRTGLVAEDGEPRQRVVDRASCRLTLADMRFAASGPGATDPQACMDAHANLPFDLSCPPLLRVALWRTADDAWVLQIVLHHIVSDGWSHGVLNRELSALYAAALLDHTPELPALPLHYADYALWQRDALAGPTYQGLLDFWCQQLDALPALALPTDRPRPAQADYRGAGLSFRIEASLAAAIHALARNNGCTLYMVLLAAFMLLLARYSAQSDIAVGTPVAGRAQPDLDPLIGLFVNTLVLRSGIDLDSPLPVLLERVRATSLAAYDHADMPFEKLVEVLRPERDPARHPLFQVMFALRNLPSTDLALPGARTRAISLGDDVAKIDLTLELSEDDGGLAAQFNYACALFDADTIARMAGHYCMLLEGFVHSPGQPVGRLPLLTPAEHGLIFGRWNGTALDLPAGDTLVSLFETQVEASPEAIALESAGQALSYAELNRRANRLAHRLRALGVGRDARVGVCMPRTAELVIALMGVLKAGGAYVPIDPDYPEPRIRYMLEDTAAPVLLTQTAMRERLAGRAATLLFVDKVDDTGLAEDDPPHIAGPDDLAYVIYTSGSTGRPKGVMISHAAICNHMHWMRATFGFDISDRMLQKTGISADASVWEFLAPLLGGGCLVLAMEGCERDPTLLAREIATARITVMQVVPSMLRALLSEPGLGEASTLCQVFCGGEALEPSLAKAFFTRSGARLHNLYGPTEATIDATWWTCTPDEDSVPIGRPIANMYARVLDERAQPVPVGVAGELYLGGIGLARGYLGRPDLTAERFLPDPFSDEPGARLYRTGDRVRWRADGALDFIGRVDHQIKLRGFRIEPGEIEAALTAEPGVDQAVVVLREDRPGDARLIAYVTGRSRRPDGSALRESLKRVLPAHLTPAAVVVLDSLPTTRHGKLDRASLPAPSFAADADPLASARTPVEALLVDVWSEVLGVAAPGIHDNFFELGGHSLLAVRLISRVRAVLGVGLPLRAVFEAPTIAKQGLLVQALRGDAPPTPLVAGAPAPGTDPPCTPAQAALWFIERWSPAQGLYHIVERWRLDRDVDAPALQRALDGLLAQHAALRTAFVERDGRPRQRVAPQADARLECIGADQADDHARRPFDLSAPPLLRAALWRTGDGRQMLQLVAHHIVSDGWSQNLIHRDLARLYRAAAAGEPLSLRPQPLGYADYAFWQRAQLDGERGRQLLAYWRQRLAGLPALALPTDRPPPAHPDHRGATLVVALDAELTRGLRALAQACGCTLYMVLVAAFALLLARWSRQTDIALGTPVAGRGQPELDEVVGLFVNTLVLRTQIDLRGSVPDLLRGVRAGVLAAFDHADQPFEALVEALRPAREAGRTPLFQVMFMLQHAASDHAAFDDPAAQPQPVGRTLAKFDLTLSVTETADTLQASFEYACALFDADTVARMAGHYRILLEGFGRQADTQVGRLALQTTAERRRLLETWNDTATAYPSATTLAALFEAQVARTPNSIALSGDGAALSYADLNAQANRLAHALRALGVGPEVCVGVCLPRSTEQVVALLGVVKAGGAYVPIDPGYPPARIEYMLADTGAAAVIAGTGVVSECALPVLSPDESAHADWPDSDPRPLGGAHDLACVFYTSGSTGQPKGVMVEQRSITRLVCATGYVRFGADETFLLLAPPTFDAATFELWGALLHGGRCIVHPEAMPTAAGLESTIRAHGVTTAWVTSALFNALIDERPHALRGLRQLLTGGEALSVPHVRRALAALPGTVLINCYGPTEGTTFTCCQTIPPTLPADWTSIPIGRPIANTSVYILDEAMQPVPVGLEGELYIGGDGLARGYVGRPDLSAERFVPHPFVAGERLYRSGDRVRWREDGSIAFIGRADAQIKLRGFRIEPGEIEAALSALPGVHRAVVDLHADSGGERRLLAWVSGNGLDGNELQSRLGRSLPEYMLPSAVVVVPAMPLTANGKLDRAALPAPAVTWATTGSRTPRDVAERHLLAIWELLFDRDGLSVDDDFFAIGGHSLLAVRLVDAIERAFGVRLPLDTFWFRGSTVRDIAGLLRDASGGRRWPMLVPMKAGGTQTPLFCVHTIGGNLFHYYELARALPDGLPVMGLNAIGVEGLDAARWRVEDIAADCIAAMRSAQAAGPYRIAGYSSGGTVAFEMAHQLLAAGETVSFLGLLDAWGPGIYQRAPDSGLARRLAARLRPYLARDRLVHAVLHRLGLRPPGGFPDGASAHWWAHWGYKWRAYPGRVDLYLAEMSRREASDPSLGWPALVSGALVLHSVNGSHGLMMKTPHVQTLADLIRRRLDEVADDAA